MYYGNIKKCDIANGPGVRVSLFVSGCRNCCRGCFQPETWNFTYGQEYTSETESFLLNELSNSYINGLTILGGDPFEPENQIVIVNLLKKVKALFPEKSIWVYTGYTLEELSDKDFRTYCDVTKDMLSFIDVLVDGRYVESLNDISLKFRGSSNQRIINLPKTFKTGKITHWGC